MIVGGGKQLSILGYYTPSLMDTLMEMDTLTEKVFAPLSKKDGRPRPLDENSLDDASGGLRERGGSH